MGNTTSSYDNDNITISTANTTTRISPTPFKYKFMNGPSGKSLMDEIVDFISEKHTLPYTDRIILGSHDNNTTDKNITDKNTNLDMVCCLTWILENLCYQEYKKRVKYSDLFIYYNARLLTYSNTMDCGTTVRNCLHAISKKGVCPEKMWGFDPENICTRPYPEAYQNTFKPKFKYGRLGNLGTVDIFERAIYYNYPILALLHVYPNLYSIDLANEKLVPPDTTDERQGYMCVVIVGYNKHSNCLLAKHTLDKFKGVLMKIDYSYVEKRCIEEAWVFALPGTEWTDTTSFKSEHYNIFENESGVESEEENDIEFEESFRN